MAEAAAEIGKGAEEEGKTVQPKATKDMEAKIRKVFKAVDEHKQARKKANENVTALREDLVTNGFSKKAQRVVAMYMDLNEQDQEFFWTSIEIMCKALGKPMQGRLELVSSNEDN